MAREIGIKGKETKLRIKEAAIYEFANNGFYNTKVSDIVKRANLSQPAFYLYFSSKDAIFEELISDFRSRLQTLMESQRLSSEIVKDEITQPVLLAIETLFEFFAEDLNLTKIGLILAHDSESFKKNIIMLLSKNLIHEQELGFYRSDLSMEIAAVCIFGMIEQLIISCLFDKTYTPKQLAEEVVQLVMNGMVK